MSDRRDQQGIFGHDPVKLAELQTRLSEIRQETSEARNDPGRWPYREAAAVLSMFNPDDLRPFKGPQVKPGWYDFMMDCEPASHRGGAWWRLRADVRREALRRLGSRERIRAALAANPDRPTDIIQRFFEDIVSARHSEIRHMSRADLSALITVREWLSGIISDLPSDSAIHRALAAADVLEPMRRLAGQHFVGRKSELDQLRAYVGVKVSSTRTSRAWRFVREQYYDFTNRPLLLVTGPGGVGKSTFLSRFILDHCEDFESSDSLPFVYIDVDRATIVPSRPISILAEAASQLAVEWPDFERELLDVADQIRRLNLVDERTSEGTRLISSSRTIIRQFAQTLKMGSTGRPVLFVIDTFEEAQVLGIEVVRAFAELLSALQRAAPMLRIVLASRGTLGDQASELLPTRTVRLGDLALADAHDLVRKSLPKDAASNKDLVAQIVEIVGTNPMSLKLATTVAIEQGVERLRGVETRGALFLRVKAETLNARLYGRILSHIHDADVRKLAKPGLVVRRLTPEIIEKVLARPCGLKIRSPHRAHELLQLLAREVALVEPAPDGSLRHRQDVRQLMLKDLTEEVPAQTIRAIHDSAIAYYAGLETDPVTRAEEIYHRLMRGDRPSELGDLWIDGVEPYLRMAVEEVPPAARLWLSRRLGITPDREILNEAKLDEWEQFAARSAQRLLESGAAEAALKTIQERKERSPLSPLYFIEAEARRLLAQFDAALKAAERGIAAAARVGGTTAHRKLLVEVALINETAGRQGEALDAILRAESTPGEETEPLEGLRLKVTKARLLRKIGDARSLPAATGELLKSVTSPELRDLLELNPALLREVVAEVGAKQGDLLTLGLQVLGFESIPSRQSEMLATALAQWDKRLGATSHRTGELGARAGIQGGVDAWRSFIARLTGRDLSRHILNWRAELSPDPAVDTAIMEVYRADVDQSLQPSTLS